MDFKNFKFFVQPIVQDGAVNSLELLLRKVGNDRAIFPEKEYTEIVGNKELHNQYLKWAENELKNILKKDPENKYYLNIDHQELEYPKTYDFLRNIFEFSTNISLEITETPSLTRKEKYYCHFNTHKYHKILKIGYTEIAFDDICQGWHTLGNLFKSIDYITRIKFSMVHFLGKLSDACIKEFLLFLNQICIDNKKEFVVEGIETEEMSVWLSKNITCFKQGYYLGKPDEIDHYVCSENRF